MFHHLTLCACTPLTSSGDILNEKVNKDHVALISTHLSCIFKFLERIELSKAGPNSHCMKKKNPVPSLCL